MIVFTKDRRTFKCMSTTNNNTQNIYNQISDEDYSLLSLDCVDAFISDDIDPSDVTELRAFCGHLLLQAKPLLLLAVHHEVLSFDDFKAQSHVVLGSANVALALNPKLDVSEADIKAAYHGIPAEHVPFWEQIRQTIQQGR